MKKLAKHQFFRVSSSLEMRVSGSTRRENDWSAFIPNGGFGVKQPPLLIGSGPSPMAVNFLQEELGHNLTPNTADSAFFNPPKFPTYGSGGPSRSAPRNNLEMKEFMSLALLLLTVGKDRHFLLSVNIGSPIIEAGDFGYSPTADSQEGRAIRALANLFTCPATTFPLSVGLFYDTGSTANASNLQSSSLTQLQEDIQMLLRLNTKALPTFSAALVLVPALTIFFAAYMLAITVNFEVGLSLGILGLFIQFFVLLSTKRAYKRICCLPAYVVVCLVGVAILIDLLLLRLFDFNTIAMLTDMRVLPIFVIMSSVIFLGVCASIPSLVNAAFAYFYRPKTPLLKAIEAYAMGSSEPRGKHKKRSPFLDSLTARLASGNDTAKSNGSCLQSSLEAADVLPLTSSCEVDILAKKEFANICDMLHAFNFYLQDIEQTRLVVMIDATEATSAVQLAGVFYQVHSLLLTQPNAPIAFVIATNVTAFYEKYSSAPRPNDTVFQESQPEESNEALSLLRGIADCNHLVLFSVQLPIFLDATTISSNSSIIQRLSGAQNLSTLLQNFANTTPISPHLSTVLQEDYGNGEHFQTDRSKISIGSTAGQINQAYTSAEELGLASREVGSEPSTVIKAAPSTTNLSTQNQQHQQQQLLKQQSDSSSTAPALVKNVNTTRITSTRAGAKGIAEIFLANEEMADLNVPVIRTLVAETAFTNIRDFYFGAVRGGGKEVELERNLPTSRGAVPTAKPHETRGSFYTAAPMPQSFDALPQCLESDYNGRSRSGGGGGRVAECRGVRGGGGTGPQNDSSGDTRSPLPVSVDSESLEKGLCYANPFNLPIVAPCPIRLKVCSLPVVELSKMNVDDVCMLLSAISDLPPSNCSSYQMQVRRQNINGQVLSVCDLAKLRTELQMTFGDWQLLNTFVMYLRGVEASLADQSRNSQTGSFVGDVKSPHGSLAVSSQYPYSQVLVSPSPFVFCNEQSQARGKNVLDVPVLVQQVPVESSVANIRQNTDRTTSDFSFGSGTDELELAWRRDAKPDSLNGNSKHQHASKDLTSRQGNAFWMESLDRLSKSTHDLRSANTSRRSQGRHISSKSGGRRLERNPRKPEKQVPKPLFHSASSAPDHLVQMVPAYISRAPDSSGVIPVWYPTLPCVGEAKKLQQPLKINEEYSSESSSVSVDGTYDFPSEYSSGDRHSQQRHMYRRQCPADCPHGHRKRRQRGKSLRSSRSINRTVQRNSSRRGSMGRCSQKSAEGCTCDYFLYEGDQSARSSTAFNPWTTRSPRKISSPDLSDIEAMTSS
ncbi:unnamed protein product [Taenia asiatica]|uniref:Transmembrane protein n=1 Tax=Taenia asiatica TaxID=60517 RepID=A0A158R977_TAEAS|nr:unnamed protein product [Taenia asiatica]